MKSHFGLFMRQMREAAGLDVKMLSHLVGCEVTIIDAVETNVRPPPGRYLIAWANAINMTVEDIVMLYINQQARRMCLEAGITPLFKVVPASWERDIEAQQQGAIPNRIDPSNYPFR